MKLIVELWSSNTAKNEKLFFEELWNVSQFHIMVDKFL